MNEVIVFGAGAIGSYFGSMLAKRYSVTLVGRKKHVESIRKNGLTIAGFSDKIAPVKTATKIGYVDRNTVIILTTKSQDTLYVAKTINDKVRSDTTIVCLQNGLGSEDIVRQFVACPVFRAITHTGVEWLNPGSIRLNGVGKTYIAKGGESIAKMLTSVGLPATVPQDFSKKVWEKLVANCVINGLGTVLDVRNSELFEEHLEVVKKQIVKECREVAAAEGVKIDAKILGAINAFLPKSTNINSTLQDIKQHKATEIDFLNGAIVRLGKKHSIPTPVNETICSIIHFKEIQ